MAMAAQLCVKVIAAAADVARAGNRVRGEAVGIHFEYAIGSHASTSSGRVEGTSAAGTGAFSPAAPATSQKPSAQRKPFLCLRERGLSPLWNWQWAWVSK